eukprot:m.98534 g.98534  ORF g.98534 m.98534 type:complete len:580 (-) comp27076_c0_seq1:332-2071(-)
MLTMLVKQGALLALTVFAGAVYLIISQTKSIVNFLRFWTWEAHFLEKEMKEASSYSDFVAAATKLDKLKGNHLWKSEPFSRRYDANGILSRLTQLQMARHTRDWETILPLIRENLFRNVCGIGNPKLYTRCAVGTKELIEKYIEEMARQVEEVGNLVQTMNLKKSLEPAGTSSTHSLELIERYISDCRQAYGRSALVLSGGVSLGMYHIGVVKCLHEQNCLPSVICGTSIGALVAGMLGVCRDEDLPRLWETGQAIDFSFFNKPTTADAEGPAWARKLRRLFKHGVLMDIQKLARFCEENIGDITFHEAYLKTGRVINITVPANKKQQAGSTLLNHITAPNVIIWSAACASCEYPGLYTSFNLLYKNQHGVVGPLFSPKFKNQNYTNSSRQHDDLPMQRLSELFNVNHFVVVQVQPHVIPFLRASKSQSRFSLLHKTTMFLAREVHHVLELMAHIPICPSFFKWIVQELGSITKGHITIAPLLSVRSFAMMLSNPSNDSFQWCIRDAERSTYPQIAEIRTRCRIEFALRDATSRMRKTTRDYDDNITVMKKIRRLTSANVLSRSRTRSTSSTSPTDMSS